jgi:hypothetical protein
MEGRINRCQLEVELVPAEHNLDYQSVYIFLSLYLVEQLDFNCCCNILICLTLF